eukprot:scaffold25064_cov97-Isochrysis_galbana.AAC.1
MPLARNVRSRARPQPWPRQASRNCVRPPLYRRRRLARCHQCPTPAPCRSLPCHPSGRQHHHPPHRIHRYPPRRS